MKRTLLLICTTFFSASIYCQVPWTINPDPVLEPGPAGSFDQAAAAMPCVLLVDDTLRMWYSGASGAEDDSTWAVGYATSTDGGMTWTKYDHNPVLNVGPVASFDAKYVYYAEVLYHESTYYMWYVGGNVSDNEAKGFATSPDGIHWTKYEGNPIDNDLTPGGVLFKDNLFHMWYNDSGTCYGTSDDGINWTKYEGNPVIESGPVGSWDRPRLQPNSVIFDGQKFHLWYSGGAFFSFQIGYATSPDGINWTKYEGNPVIPRGSAGSMGEEATFYPSVIFDDSNSLYKMWYQAWPGGIGYAEAPVDTSSTGISSPPSDSKFMIYPNPVDKLLTVEMKSQGIHTVEILSLNGQVVLSEEMEGNTNQLDLSSFRNGIYLITIRSKDFVTTRKIIKM